MYQRGKRTTAEVLGEKGERGQDLIVLEYSLTYNQKKLGVFFRYNTPANVILLTCVSGSGLQTSCGKFSTVLPAFQPLRVCDGSLVTLRIDTRLKGLELFFCTVITGTLQRVVRCFDKVWSLGGSVL